MKRLTDYNKFKNILPYASEMFGIYQPLLGWKSKRIEERQKNGFQQDRKKLLEVLATKFKANVSLDSTSIENCQISAVEMFAGSVNEREKKKQDSILLQFIGERVPQYSDYKPSIWDSLLTRDKVDSLIKERVIPHYKTAFTNLCESMGQLADVRDIQNIPPIDSIDKQLKHESSLAGMLLFFVENKNFVALEDLFYSSKNNLAELEQLSNMLKGKTPRDEFLNISNIDPKDLAQLKSVGLSPISVVHLYRQYFFEFDTFLGSPVEHLWLSPGSTVELVEVSTRKTTTEQTIETTLDRSQKYEGSITDKDELSLSVKEDNRSDTKFGANVSAQQGWIGGEASASATLDLAMTQQKAREVVHKKMREQTTKLSSEIRQNYKSTFKTITEVTDTSSKRYVLNNTTSDLINYELRRKMRQVGVQVQDVGTYMCWQTYVDDPGAELGLAELVHIAKEPDVAGKPQHPADVVIPTSFEQVEVIQIPFVGVGDNDDKGEHYTNGLETDDGDLTIQWIFPKSYTCEKPNFFLKAVALEALDDVNPSSDFDPDKSESKAGKFNIRLNSVHFHDQQSVKIRVKLLWHPDEVAAQRIKNAALAQYEKDLADYNAKVEREYHKEFLNAAKDRVTLASRITSRKYEELREEERIVVYRKLVQGMLMKGVSMPDDATRHVVAELINSIFDIDKMLYFVSPEWWRPRLHRSHQNLGSFKKPSTEVLNATNVLDKSMFAKVSAIPYFANALAKKVSSPRETPLKSHVTGWGGIKGERDDNYYITESSEPAKLGSSLGWLMQLDGDNLRNAFLNAPWVKAVVPIRPGKEEAALNWLQKVEGTNGIEPDAVYRTDNPKELASDGVTPLNGMPLIEVLKDLAKKVAAKHRASLDTGVYPVQDPADPVLVDPANTVTATPIDRVYEHGFYPLVGGFRNKTTEENFPLIDQWTEILPTDQIVPVEVKYDSKTGRLL
jgi:hypothetical protein